MNSVLQALHFRHACKVFDPDRKIPADELKEIVDCGRMSPSSFGMEPWRFLVLQDTVLREKLRPAAWGQAQIVDSSEVVVILTRSDTLLGGSDYITASMVKRNPDEEALAFFQGRYKKHHDAEVEPQMSLYAWGSKQCYIALANIMTAAAALGVDSCPIEGFNKQDVEKVLGLEGSDYQVAVMVALGYRAGEQTPRFRQDFDALVEYR